MVLGKNINVHTFADAEQAIEGLCMRAGNIINDALRTKGRAHLVLSGGRSPTRYLPLLASRVLDWSGVQVSMSDERWVPIEHADSNQRMLKQTFFDHIYGAKLNGLMGKGENAESDAQASSQRYACLSWPADVSLLGLGPDGHVASLFPGRDYGSEKQFVIATCDPAGRKRLTLSPQALMKTRAIILLACGEDKRSIINDAMQTGSVKELPLRLLLHQTTTNVDLLMC